MISVERVAADLIELLRIPSPTYRENAVSAWLAEHLAELGIDAHDDGKAAEIGGECGNLVATIPGTVDAPSLLLNAHMDNVPPCENVNPVTDGPIIRSDGTTVLGGDDKCGCITILTALREVLQNDRPRPPLDIVFTVAEEVGLLGAGALDFAALTAKRGIVCESGTVGSITVKAPSSERWEAAVTGTAAHAGVAPEKGVNAIRIAAEAIAEMRIGRLDDETTANVGLIEGGEARNVVAPQCTIQGEARSHDPDKLADQMADVERCLREAAQRHGGSVDISRGYSYTAFSIDRDAWPLTVATRAARDVEIEPMPRPTGGGSDANVFNEHGIETVIICTGSQDVHTTQEHVDVRDVHRACHWLTRILELAAEIE